MHRKTLLIFDMDGTLTDTVRATHLACSQIAPQYGLQPLSVAAIQDLIGLHNPEFYYAMYPQVDRQIIDAFGHQVEACESRAIQQIGRAFLFDGVYDMLAALRAQGHWLAIASAGSMDHVQVALQATGILPLFDTISAGLADKATGVTQLLEAYHPAAAVMIGDRQNDINAARANHIPALGAGFGYCRSQDYPLFDQVFATPQQLVAWGQSFGL